MKNLDLVIAKAFTASSNEEQAALLNLMARELYVGCRGYNGFDSQCYEISRDINADAVAFMKCLVEYYELRQKDMSR